MFLRSARGDTHTIKLFKKILKKLYLKFFSFIAGVVDTAEQHPFAIISTNFRKKSKRSQRHTQGPGGNWFRKKNLKSNISCQTPFKDDVPVNGFSAISAVAEFIDPVRELKPDLTKGYIWFKVWLKGGGVWLIPPFNPTLKLALNPVHDLWIRLLLHECQLAIEP